MKTSHLEVFNRYLQFQTTLPEKKRQPPPLAITLSREAGAGGIEIAELLAQRMMAAESQRAIESKG